MTPAPPRSLAERLSDTRRRLRTDVDCWVATTGPGSGDGLPYLVVLSFLWLDDAVWLSTSRSTATVRNLEANPRVRIGIGATRDVVLVEGPVELLDPAGLPDGVGDAFAVKSGFDPRTLSSPYAYVRVLPHRVQAWREENELARRDLMRDGRWLG